ncbi:putative leucine-rich repeat domain superfamily [Helianthus annuus]|nr:putative leucine-rich repeat domain superfamily [Helianthus annuus]
MMKKSLMLFWAYLAITQSAKLDSQEGTPANLGKIRATTAKKFGSVQFQRGWVTCDCSLEGHTTCHVNNVNIRYQNMSGALLLEFIKLPYLKSFTLMGNRLSGPFRTTLTTMTTLRLFSSIWWYFLYYTCPHHRFVYLQMRHAETKKGKGKK